ncbi:MAG: DUF2304 family protein [Patescibacteria group bacterium]
MYFQELIALILIAFFVSRLFAQKKKKTISKNEFQLWLFFWIIAALSVVFLKPLDRLVASLGFTASSITVLFYGAVFILFYLVFKLRLSFAKMDRDLTTLIREMAILKEEQKK